MGGKDSNSAIYDGAYLHIVVAHLMGELEAVGEIKTGFSDYEEYAEVVNGIVTDWKGHRGIESNAEEGYIAEYASRRLHEAFFSGGDKEGGEEVF